MEFKDRLKELRTEKGLTQKALGDEIHVSRSAIAKWEAGLGLPSEDSLMAICEYFDVPKEKLLCDEKTEELLVGKNLKIKRHKNTIVKLLVALLGALLAVVAVTAYFTVERYERLLKVEKLKAVTPTVTKMFFENPYTNLEPTPTMEESRYVLEKGVFTKLYLEIEVDDSACQNWYSFDPTFKGFIDFAVEEESCRWGGEENSIRIFFISVYVRSDTVGEHALTLSQFIFFHTIEGVGYEKVCSIEAKPIDVVVKERIIK